MATPLKSNHEQEWRSKPMNERLAFVYMNQLFTDIALVVFVGSDEYVFMVHKSILAFHSPVLEEMFYENEHEELFYKEIEGVDPRGLDYVLKKLYHVPSSSSNHEDRGVLLSAYHAAKILGVHRIETDLKQVILNEILTKSLVTNDDFWKILELSRILDLKDITDRLLRFAESNSKAILLAKSLAKASPMTLRSVLELDVLNTSEKDVLDSIASWQQKNRTLPFVGEFFQDLLKCVRFRNLSPLDVCQFVANNPDLINSDDILKIMMHLGNPASEPLPTWCSTKFRRSMAFLSKDDISAVQNVQRSSKVPNNSKLPKFNMGRGTSLLAMYLEQKYTDVCFVVGNEKKQIKAHRSILAVSSVVFEKMFFSWIPDTRYVIDIPGHDPQIFDKMLMYFYDDSNPDLLFKSDEVLRTALKYGSMNLKNACLKNFTPVIIDPSTYWKKMESVGKNPENPSKSLRQFLYYASKDTGGVLSFPGFLGTSLEAIKYILQLDTVSVKEIEILKRAVKWLKRSSKSGQLKYDILSLIRFSNITIEEFCNFSAKHSDIFSETDVLSILSHLHNKESPLPAWCYKGKPRLLGPSLPYE